MTPTTVLGWATCPSGTVTEVSVPSTGLKMACSPTWAMGIGSCSLSNRVVWAPGAMLQWIGPSMYEAGMMMSLW